MSDPKPDGPVEPTRNAMFDRPSGTGVAGERQGAHEEPGAWLRPAVVGCWLAGGVILVAAGVSGLVSEAAAQHHWGEVVEGRVAAGVLGLLVLLLLWALRRGSILGAGAWTPPRLAVAPPLGAAFTAVGVLFTGLSVVQLTFHDGDTVGANLATGLVSLLAAVGVVIWLAARRRRQLPTR